MALGNLDSIAESFRSKAAVAPEAKPEQKSTRSKAKSKGKKAEEPEVAGAKE